MWLLGRLSFVFILLALTFVYIQNYVLYSFLNEPLDTSLNYNVVEIIKSNGYECEKHSVITEDGYILELFRLRAKGVETRRPVLMMHGVLQNGAIWIDAGPQDSLAYLLANKGHDVWLGTVRGTRYARQNVNLKPTDPGFWSFTHDDMAQYDLPAQIDFITNHTRSKSINYIGYSQGGMIGIIMLSEKIGYDKINKFVGLAPGSRMLNTKSAGAKLITNTLMSLKKIGVGKDGLEIMGDWSILKKLQEYYCCAGYVEKCASIISNLDSAHPGSISESTYKIMFINYPDGTSIDNIIKYRLLNERGRLHKKDFGKVVNMQVYGSETPPDYNLSNVKTKILILNGKSDNIVDVEDSIWLNSQLVNSQIKIVKDPLWNHVDMVYSQNIKTMILPDVQEFLTSD